MTALMIVSVRVISSEWVSEYSENVPAIVSKYGGERVAQATDILHVEGAWPKPDALAIFKFGSRSKAVQFLESEEYRPYREARSKGAESNIFIMDT